MNERQVLPSGPERNNDEPGPFEKIVSWAKRHPRTTAFVAGSALGTPALGVAASVITHYALKTIPSFKMMKYEAIAEHADQQAEKFASAGNTRRADQARKEADKARKVIANI